MSPPIDIDGSEIQRATIDGEDVSEITIDGQQTAGFVDIPDSALTQIADHIWFIDEGDGGTVADSVGSQDGAISGATWVSGSGGVGGAFLDFAGSDDIVDFGNLFTTASQFTVSGWVQLQDSSQGYLFQQGVTDFLIQTRDEVLESSEPFVQTFVGGNKTDSFAGEVGDRVGDFAMLTVTYGSGTARLYCHHVTAGKIVDTTVSTSDPSWSSGDSFTMGNREDLDRPLSNGADMGLVARQEASESDVLDHFNETVRNYE